MLQMINIETTAMTPAHTDTPLRRSEASMFREGSHNVTINDDEEERRQARRRSMIRHSTTGDSMEDSENLKKCLELYNCNKLSKENAWSYSLIDTLSKLLDRHHKSLNNFKVAGSSLEASSKVYGLRVDCIHTDVLRMSAGLNAKKFNEDQRRDDDDDVEESNKTNADAPVEIDPNTGDVIKQTEKPKEKQAAKPKKKPRKYTSTVTKNKESLNHRLDTVPMQDPIFGKLNSIVGSINSVHRLMNNVLISKDSELQLSSKRKFWDSSVLEEGINYFEELAITEDIETVSCDRLFRISKLDYLLIRPLHGGYIISDQPEDTSDDDLEAERLSVSSDGPPQTFDNGKEISMAFDINAACEPVPAEGTQIPMLDVDYNDYEDLTAAERTAINNCRGLRRAPVLIEDLRPIDSTSKLEYSYRPLDKISQFWAGPSHWKFKRGRPRPSALQSQSGTGRAFTQKGRRTQSMANKKRMQQLKFNNFHDDLFIKKDAKHKMRKANFQKKWDQRKLKLPTDLQLDQDLFKKYTTAPGIHITPVAAELEFTQPLETDNLEPDSCPADEDFNFAPHFNEDDNNDPNENPQPQLPSDPEVDLPPEINPNIEGLPSDPNNTVLEIGHEYEGAPQQVTKIIVPFAKRAKVVDMKGLKRSCLQLMSDQMKRTVEEKDIPQHPILKNEKYGEGVASFREIYDHLPEVLSANMTEALTPAVAFYSILHLSNDHDLRLIPQDDMEDFAIRKVLS